MISLYFAIVAASVVGAFLLRFDFTIDDSLRPLLLTGLATALPIKFLVFRASGLFRGRTRHDGILEAFDVIRANVLASAAFAPACFALAGLAFPRSVYILDALLCLLATMALRLQPRISAELAHLGQHDRESRSVLIYGAGSAGAMLARELRQNPALGREAVGFLDDDPRKRGVSVGGVRVLGGGADLPELLASGLGPLDEIVIAMPSASGREVARALEFSRAASAPVKTLPSLGDLIESPRRLSERIRDLSIADLLGRAPVKLDQTRIRGEIAGRVVLVTGAGGSIGSELCRQVAAYGPKQLICLDHAESDLYRIDIELRRLHPNLPIVPLVGDIRDAGRMEETFAGRGIDVVFHAAAYKHVPMMEAQPIEVVTTNVLGTWNLADAARRHGVPAFVMISSDKAVNPTNVMGLTKRTAELIVASRETDPANRTKFVSVRFGNVLGSNGSVVPLFQQQIAAGGPLTVTDARMTRYFMTIPEAVQLVLQASVLGARSEIFVLDMGQPVKIVDLARNMIRLADLAPDRDIAIEYVGLRDGEKMYEELITEGENIVPTDHEKIKVFRGQAVKATEMERWLAGLRRAVAARDENEIVGCLAALVPEYVPGPRWQAVRGETASRRRDAALIGAGS